jgi:nucleoside-diphosphate-sugar epimerase
MRKKVILITGACGEIGHALVAHLLDYSNLPIVTLDLQEMKDELNGKVTHIRGSVTDEGLLQQLVGEYEFDTIFHLASLLSTTAEFTPVMAHNVNVQGTLYLLNIAAEQSEFRGKPVKFIYPSSIATYGMPDLKTKSEYQKVKEWEWNYPSTMYGANKLYCELLGIYFSDHYKQLAESRPIKLDFRAIRFPGLISAFTVPSGGTSDYGPMMLHAAAKGVSYDSFVRPDTTINFMAMPDAVKALVDLEKAPAEKLSRRVYNVTSFSLSAEQFCDKVMESFPDAEIGYKVHENRQNIVDTWPMDTDDKAAREDWGWDPDYDIEKCFRDYLVPHIKNRY